MNERWVVEDSCWLEWPECYSDGYDPRCCRFPKSCSCMAPVRGIELGWRVELATLHGDPFLEVTPLDAIR